MTFRYELDHGLLSLSETITEVVEILTDKDISPGTVPIIDVDSKPIERAVLLKSTDENGKDHYKLMLF